MKDADLGCNLVMEARKASERAYCPYSGFAVGAALLARDGRIFRGVNVENASYGLTICAERNAVAAAAAAGAIEFSALAVAGGTEDRPAVPCGACLQVLAEFCKPDLAVFIAPLRGGRIRKTSLGRLLPRAFALDARRRPAAARRGWGKA